MIEVDCRKCVNCEENECKKYGKDEKQATSECAKNQFKNYIVRAERLNKYG